MAKSAEEREAAGAFLMKAFGAAIFLIFAILLAQFNRFSSVLLVLSAVVLSTIGVLIGLMVMGQAFGVVMTGIGVIANAGVIVNNNIVLIDTYDRLRREGRRSPTSPHGATGGGRRVSRGVPLPRPRLLRMPIPSRPNINQKLYPIKAGGTILYP